MIQNLNDTFGISQHVTFHLGHNGMPKAVIANRHSTAEIYLHGAHVTSFQPQGAEEVLWLSEAAQFRQGKAIRGGIPIIWPWFGDHPTDTDQPAHGFARTAEWSVSETMALPGQRTKISFSLTHSAKTESLWPHPFMLELHVTVGRQLQVDLVTHNYHTEGVNISQALHTFFNVGDIAQVAVTGLSGRTYLDKVQGYKEFPQYGAIPFLEETDRVYLDTTDECIIDDQALKRKIYVDKLGSKSTVVWNPWVDKAKQMGDFPDNGYETMVCVETTNAANDARRVPPRGDHVLTQLIRLG